MNVVPAVLYKSSDFKPRLYEVPEYQILRKGDFILVQFGPEAELAVCESDSFHMEEGPFNYILNMFGSNREILPVVGRLIPEIWVEESTAIKKEN